MIYVVAGSVIVIYNFYSEAYCPQLNLVVNNLSVGLIRRVVSPTQLLTVLFELDVEMLQVVKLLR